MPLSRRTFVRTVGLATVTAVGGRILPGGRVIGPWTRSFDEALEAAEAGRPLLLHNNENPLGPGDKAIASMRARLTETGMPTARYTSFDGELGEALAHKFGCKPENVIIGCGSTQILRSATHAFTSPVKHLVGGTPTYEECTDYAMLIGTPVTAIPLTPTLHLDLDGMAAASKGAGMVFLNNPNNPTATVHPASAITAFVERVLRTSPETTVIIDEAYHDYVTDPSHKSQIPLALENPRVIVARTFSKAYGMAGLRVGYAIARPETIRKIREIQYGQGTNVLGETAALASIPDAARLDEERRRNTEARQFTIDWFKSAGFASTDSQCNFIFVDVQQPAKQFRDGCRQQDVIVGRDFPPFEKTHARISIGTIDEMKQAVQVFAKILGATAKAAA